jgi:ribonuclease-3
MKNILTLERLFKNKALLTQALTHKSWVNEHPQKRSSNERLEFLGDAVLELIVSKALFEQFPDKEEGYLTFLRANLVNTKNLAHVAEKLNIGDKLYLSKGEEESGGRKNPSLLADTLEAVIGALYLDQGLKTCEKFVTDKILNEIPRKVKGPLKDAKTRLQEFVQAKGYPAPQYKVVKEFGPDHAKTFEVEVLVNTKKLATGKGRNKNEASQQAARKVLLKFAKDKSLVKKEQSR